jgi:hypothetical protein
VSDGKTAGGLRCLGGESPPAGVAGDVRDIERLPNRVRADFWEALAPNLAADLDESAAQAVAAFCRARSVSQSDLEGPVRACRFLFRQAAANNLGLDDLRADVRSLCGDGIGPVEDLLIGWYERALPALRQEIAIAAIAAHGNLATGVDWRLDMVRQSQGGVAIDVPVVLMTFRYREGEQQKRITLQFLPGLVKDLQAICDKMMT